jgi:hypothetical protein
MRQLYNPLLPNDRMLVMIRVPRTHQIRANAMLARAPS